MYKLMYLMPGSNWQVYAVGSEAEMLLLMTDLLLRIRNGTDRKILRVAVFKEVAAEEV